MSNQIEFIWGAYPKVTLEWATPDWVVAMATRGYTGDYSGEISAADVSRFWYELKETKLKTPLEMASTFWLLEDVSRAFTQQLARYRQGISIVQESQRFAIQGEGIREGEIENKPRVLVPKNIVDSPMLEEYCEAITRSSETYWKYIYEGGDIQDARSLLPLATCTRLYLSVNVKTLVHIYEQRMCCQAQAEEWGKVMYEMKLSLQKNNFHNYSNQLQPPWKNKNVVSCGFGASFDRPCIHQDLFRHNLLAKEI